MPSVARTTFLLFAVLTVLAPLRAGDQSDAAWISGIFTGRSPLPESVTKSDAPRRAQAVATTRPGTFVLVGGGESMRPLYTDGTILVCRQLPYAELARGMTALYRNKENRVVAHVLVAKARDGWRVAGLNNRLHDMEPVVAGNLVGVVFAAFTPSPLLAANERRR